MNKARRNPAETELVLRQATLTDIPAIAMIHRLAFFGAMPSMPVLHTPEEALTFYATVVFPRSQVWLTEHSGLTTGFIAFRPDWVDHLYIHPDYQRCGLGSKLLAAAKAFALSLRLWTFQCNLGARRFYERHGFRIEQTTDGTHNDERHPDILYLWTRS